MSKFTSKKLKELTPKFHPTLNLEYLLHDYNESDFESNTLEESIAERQEKDMTASQQADRLFTKWTLEELEEISPFISHEHIHDAGRQVLMQRTIRSLKEHLADDEDSDTGNGRRRRKYIGNAHEGHVPNGTPAAADRAKSYLEKNVTGQVYNMLDAIAISGEDPTATVQALVQKIWEINNQIVAQRIKRGFAA